MDNHDSHDRQDHYEVLQVSPRADKDTIERVFRHLAKRFHPDNSETGDAERFSALVTAFRVLSDPEQRAAYDAGYEEQRREQWQLFDQKASASNVESDRRIRLGMLTVLYQARRQDVDRPGLGVLELEGILDCPQDHMKFHLWYMREQGWVERLENGTLAITVEGVDYLTEQDIPWADPERILPAATSGARATRDSTTESHGPEDQNGTEPTEEREPAPAGAGPRFETGAPQAASGF